MKHIKKKKQTLSYVDKVECDKCHNIFDEHDFVNWQEAVCISMVGGYGSVFGDGAAITLDLCQDCFKELCGDYVIIT